MGARSSPLFPLADRRNWVAWTPEGVYAATPGAHGILRWHVNRGWDAPAEAIPVAEIPETYRPEAIRLVLQTLDTPRAIGLAILAEIRAAIQRRTGAAVAPGARLHVLTVGVSDYGQAATHLKLTFAVADATDVAAALLTTQKGLYAEVRPQRLSNQDATKEGILRGLATIRQDMARSEPGRDLAVVHFSGHGALLDGEFYVLPHGVNAGDEVAIKTTALPASDLRRELDGLAPYGRVLVLLDACRSGGAMATGQALTADATRLRAALVGPNITVLTSSTAAELSREDPTWGNGVFTKIVLEALSSRADANRNGLISISELTGYLTRHVPGLTDGAQHPGVEMRFDGDVFVAGF
jgi:Caspase domain